MTKFARGKAVLGWLAHIVSWCPRNTRVIFNANLNPPLFHVKITVEKSRIKSSSKQINILSTFTQIVFQEEGKYHQIVAW